MRVVILGPTYPFRGGIAHYTTLLAQHLADRHEVTLLSFVGQYPPVLFPGRTDRDPSDHVVATEAELVLAPLQPWTWWRTARRAATRRPQLVVIQWWVPFWAPTLAVVAALLRRWSNARLVFVCHNVLPHGGGGPLDRALVRLALSQGQAFVVHSEADEKSLIALLPEVTAGGERVHRAVLPLHTIAPSVGRREARRRLALPPDASVALFFGFVRPYKGLAYLVDALPQVLDQVPKFHLLVAGEFWESAAEHELRAAELGVAGRMHLDDRYIPNEEVGRYFAAADVVVLPYTEATQSGVVTLAYQFGRPVIATRAGGLPEVVDDGLTGLIVPPADSSALAAALVRVFREPGLAQRLRSGVREAEGRFSWSRLVTLLESLVDRA